jgi:REP element-mobilizing transposase RayT
MTNYRRNFVPGGSYFVTVNLADRRLQLLTEHFELLRAAFRYTRERHPFTVEATVTLPDHLHAIWTLPDGDANFALRWRLIKTEFSRAACRMGGPSRGLISQKRDGYRYAPPILRKQRNQASHGRTAGVSSGMPRARHIR